MRRCIVSGNALAKSDMLRFVLSPDHVVTFDINQKLPGRGLWVSPDSEVLAQAIKKNTFAKAAKHKAVIPDGLIAQVLATLRQKLFDMFCMANRAGYLAAGADQCLESLRQGQAGMYITSSGIDSEMRRRIENKNPDLPVIDEFSDNELGRIIGKDELTHMIVKNGDICLKIMHWHDIYKKLKTG